MNGLSSARVNSAEKDFLYNSGFLANQRSSWASKSSYIVFDFYYVMFGSFCIFHNFELSLKRSRRKTQVKYLKTFASGHLLLKTLLYHSGFYLGGLRGGRFPPKTAQLSPPKSCDHSGQCTWSKHSQAVQDTIWQGTWSSAVICWPHGTAGSVFVLFVQYELNIDSMDKFVTRKPRKRVTISHCCVSKS